MTLTTHAIVGAAAASIFPHHPAVAFSVAFASHFLADAIPHLDYKILSSSINPEIGGKITLNKLFFLDVFRIGTDAFLGLMLALFLFSTPRNFWIVFLGAIFGVLPDFLEFVYTRLRSQPFIALHQFHKWIHTKNRFSNIPIFSLFSQAIFVLVIILLAKWPF